MAALNPYQPVELVSADQLAAIHETAMRILEEIGVELLNDPVIELFASAGAEVDRCRPHRPHRSRPRRRSGAP